MIAALASRRIDELLALAQRGQSELLRGRGRSAGALLPSDGGAVRRGGPAGGARALADRPLRRPPRRGRVRAPGDRRQAGACRRSGSRGEGGALPLQVDVVAEPDDIAIAYGIGDDESGETAEALALARDRGCLTIAFAPGDAEWEFEPPGRDPFVRQELVETLYHVLWELVHVFFEHRGLLEGREAGPVHDTGASSFLYPFLSEGEHDLEAVVDDVRRSILMKSEEVGALREQTLTDNRDTLLAAAAELRRALRARRQAARVRERRLGHRRDGRGRRLPRRAARAGRPRRGDRPHRGRLDPDRDRQRHRRRGDLPAPGDRLRARGRRRAGAVHERQLAEHHRGARRGSRARAC